MSFSGCCSNEGQRQACLQKQFELQIQYNTNTNIIIVALTPLSFEGKKNKHSTNNEPKKIKKIQVSIIF